MNHIRSCLLSTVAVAAYFIAPASAWACSPASIHTPEALVLLADGIYHVRAESQSPSGNANESDRTMPWPSERVEFTVLGVLKGPAQSTISVAAELGPDDDWNDHQVPYGFVRPGGRRGNCFAVTFKLDAQYLLFIRDGTPHWSPLAPTSEQVTGSDDPWITWVRQRLLPTAERPNQSFKPTSLRDAA